MTEGIDQVEKLVDLVGQGCNVAYKMKHTEGNIIQKAARLTDLASELVALSGLDVAKLKAQLGDLDATEKAALLQRFDGKFDIPNHALEGHLEEALAIALEQEKLVERMVAFGKSLKVPS